MRSFFALASALLIVNGANGFGWGGPLGLGPMFGGGGGGGGCGCAAPVAAPCAAPLPPPPQLSCGPPPPSNCAPPPPPCPPPPPPPQLTCPAPQPCQVCQPPPPPQCPPPPPPPPPCPPPPPPPPQQVCPQPQPQFCAPPPPPPQPQAHNDCCNQCQSPCRFRVRKAFGALIAQRNVDAMCNSEKLRSLMLENMSESTSDSKRAIQKAAEEKLQGKYDVICASGEFSYVVHSNAFCLETLNNVTCYAFRH